MIEVLRQGIYTSIQDLGRFDYQSYGVPISGALDQQAFGIGNKLLNNPIGTAALECSFKGPKLRFHQATHIALTGADMNVKINGKTIKNYTPIAVAEGSILDMGTAQNGCRTYLAVAGGIQTSEVLGSRSQFKDITKSERIRKKTLLPIGFSNFIAPKGSHLASQKQNQNDQVLEAYPGPEFNNLSPSQQEQLINTNLSISPLNNRMAYQLEEKIKHQLTPIWTGPVLYGTVQCTPDGSIIILMRDAQVTGGYPRLLQLTQTALYLLAQKTTKSQFQFKLRPLIE
jgi:biotin-dependent carboxylase-like uncharacterized protein